MKEPLKKNVVLDEGLSEIRLDHYLSQMFPDISRAYLQKELIEKNKVKVNQKSIKKKGFMLHASDVLDIEDFLEPQERRILPNNELDVDIVFENEDYVIFNKPQGLPTHPNQFDDKETLSNVFMQKYPQANSVGEDYLRPGVVHRLDTDTSGCIAFAKTQSAYTMFRKKFDEREMYKLYLAVVIGKTKSKEKIEYNLAHHQGNPKKMVAMVHDRIAHRGQVKSAATAFHCLTQNDRFSLLLVKTFTGRMHQVRIHLSTIGHPLVGDKIYQKRQEQHLDLKGLKKHGLHAYALGFYDEAQQKQYFKAQISEHFLEVLKKAELNMEKINFDLLFLSMQEFLDSHPFVDPRV